MAGNVVLASIAPADFEASTSVGVGAVWPTDGVVAPRQGIARVKGGTLYLVTVRPDERVWLVARLQAPIHMRRRRRAVRRCSERSATSSARTSPSPPPRWGPTASGA